MNKIALQAFQESFDNTLALLENGEVETSPAIEKMASAYEIGLEGDQAVTYESLLAKLASGGTPALRGTAYSPDRVSARSMERGAKGSSGVFPPNKERRKGLGGSALASAKGHAHRGYKATKKYLATHPKTRGALYGAAGLAAAGGLAYGAHRLMKKDDDKD